MIPKSNGKIVINNAIHHKTGHNIPSTTKQKNLTDREALFICYSALSWCIGNIDGLGGKTNYPRIQADIIKRHLDQK